MGTKYIDGSIKFAKYSLLSLLYHASTIQSANLNIKEGALTTEEYTCYGYIEYLCGSIPTITTTSAALCKINHIYNDNDDLHTFTITTSLPVLTVESGSQYKVVATAIQFSVTTYSTAVSNLSIKYFNNDIIWNEGNIAFTFYF